MPKNTIALQDSPKSGWNSELWIGAEADHDNDLSVGLAYTDLEGVKRRGSIFLTRASREALLAHLAEVDGARATTPTAVHEGEHGDERTAWNDAALSAALGHGRTAAFSYGKGNGTSLEHRQLKPLNRYDNNGTIIYFGNDPDRDDVRAYRLDRITGYVVVA